MCSAKLLCIHCHILIFQTSAPTQYVWYQTTIMISEDINSPEAFNWKIALSVVVAWVLVSVFVCMIKGIASSGKVSSYKLQWICGMCIARSIVPLHKSYKLFTTMKPSGKLTQLLASLLSVCVSLSLSSPSPTM